MNRKVRDIRTFTMESDLCDLGSLGQSSLGSMDNIALQGFGNVCTKLYSPLNGLSYIGGW